jgi:tRNA (cmo5U34)-methyltransferase
MTGTVVAGDIAERFDTGGWEFTPEVVGVFDDHVRQSVPHYDVIQDLVATASDWLLPAGGVYVDLGASTGTTAGIILDRHPDRDATAWLYDDQPDMLARAREKLAAYGGRVETVEARIETGPLKHAGADLTTCLWTLQFLPLAARVDALRLAREASKPSGAILIAEKVRPVDARWAEIANDCSHDWKADHGIPDAAIRAKARALRGVLRPLPADTLVSLMSVAGWTNIDVIFRWHSWVLVGAFATETGYDVS